MEKLPGFLLDYGNSNVFDISIVYYHYTLYCILSLFHNIIAEAIK